MTLNKQVVKQSLQTVPAELSKHITGGASYYDPSTAIPSILDFNHPNHPNNQRPPFTPFVNDRGF